MDSYEDMAAELRKVQKEFNEFVGAELTTFRKRFTALENRVAALEAEFVKRDKAAAKALRDRR